MTIGALDSFDAAAFGQALHDEISTRGLGSIPKRELDMLILHLLEKHGGLSNLSNGEISIRLRAPESRIKSLRYEAALRFGGELRDAYRARLASLMERARLDARKDEVIFVIEDQFVRSQLLSDLKAIGSYADWSFNSELLRIKPEALAEVLVGVIPQEIVDEARTGLGVTTVEKARTKLKDAITATIEDARSKAGEKVVELGTDWVKQGANKLPALAAKALLMLAL